MRNEKVARAQIATWYRCDRSLWRVEILPFRVVAFTDKTVTYIDGRSESRANIDSEYHHYAPSWDAAKAWVIAAAERKVRNAQDALMRTEGVLAQAKALPEAPHD